MYIPLKKAKANDGWLFLLFYHIGNAVIKTLNFVGKIIFNICYFIGDVIFGRIKKSFNFVLNEISKTQSIWIHRLKLAVSPDFRRGLGVFMFLAIFSLGGFGIIRLAARGFEIKGQILGTSINGSQYLQDAKGALEQQNFETASSNFLLAYQSFNDGQKQLDQTNKTLLGMLNLVPQAKDAQEILEASKLLASSGSEMVELYKNLNQLKFTEQGLDSTNGPAVDILNNSGKNISAVLTGISQAEEHLNNVNISNLPGQYQDVILDLKSQLGIAKNALTSLRDIFSVFSKMIEGQKNILVLFENYNELRATGGFMGTFGDYKVVDGSIKSVHISSIYDLDGQLKEKIIPPTPIMAVNNRWYLRDSNWFANFPDTAKIITSFYEKEGGETPDIIITLTPQIIIDLLKLTGPISLPAYNLTLNSDNFLEKTQVASTMSNDSPLNNPKQVLADMFPVLLKKISSLNPEQTPVLLEYLQNNLSSKQIVLFSRDAETQKELQSFNWTGQLSPTDRDYLSVVSTNLSGTKTDTYVKQKISLVSAINQDGEIVNTLTITRTNTLPGNLKETNNDSFIRIYAPLGSKLLANTGFDFKNLNTGDLQKDPGYKTNPQVYEWEKNSVRDVISGTYIGQEADKTYFGNWLNVNGGETKTLSLTYKLPFKLNSLDHYSLLIQKQIGALSQDFSWTLNFPTRSIAWKNFDPSQLNTSSLNSDIILNKDYFLGLVFSKQ